MIQAQKKIFIDDRARVRSWTVPKSVFSRL